MSNWATFRCLNCGGKVVLTSKGLGTCGPEWAISIYGVLWRPQIFRTALECWKAHHELCKETPDEQSV